MPRRLTMGTIVTRSLRRADKENDGQISNAEAKALASEQYGELHEVVSSSGMEYFVSTLSIPTTGAAYYAEPTDHLSTLTLDRVIDAAGTRRTIREIMAQERARWAGRSGSDAIVYSHVDDRIFFYPNPPSGLTYELTYIPQPPDLSSYGDSDVVDVVTADGEAFLIWGTAIKMLAKSESDVRLAISEREAARDRLLEWSIAKALLQPRRRFVDEFDARDMPLSDADWRFNR